VSHVIDVFENLCESKAVLHDGSLLHVQHGEADQEMKIRAGPVSPKNFPDPHYVTEGKLSFEPDEEPSEAEEQVARVLGVQVAVELGIVRFEELC